MFCAYCRQELLEDALFCNRCGKQVQLSASETRELLWSGGIQQTPPAVSDITTSEANTVFSDPAGPFIPPHGTIQTSQTPPSFSALQRFLIRAFQPTLAGNALFGIIAGCIVAVSAGAVTSWLILTLVHITAPQTAQTAFLASGEGTIDSVLGITLLHIPLRDSLQLFLVMHGVSIHLLYGTTSNTVTAPLHGLLIIPAVFLIVGGYIAASTDLHNQIQRSFVRGAAIALPYTLLLLILSWQVNGNIPIPANTAGSTQDTLMVDTTSIFVFGLLWGALFGLLGASLKIAHGQWRHLIRRYLYTNAHSQIAGMITGACYACILGLGLSFLTLCGLLAYTAFSTPLLARNLCIAGNWQALLAWGIAQGPLHAINLFFFSFGASIITHIPQTGQEQCFYTDLSRTAFTLHNPNLHLTLWTYTLLLIPALSLFVGGRISVAISRAQGKGPSAISGALIAVPFTIIMLFLTFISTITDTITFPGASTAYVQSVGTSASDVLLWALLSGALFGALGGVYQGSMAKSWHKRFLALPAFVIELLAQPVYLLLMLLSKQPTSSLRNSTRSLLYGTLSCVLLLAIATAVVGSLLIVDNQIITQQVNQHVRDIASVLLITIPGLLLFCACTTAVCRDPVEEAQHKLI